MSAKESTFDVDARNKVLDGVDTGLAIKVDPRAETLSSKWRTCRRKDGVTVAKEIELEDKFSNMGAQMVKEVASKTSDTAGDGTTTATILAQSIYQNGLKLVAAGHSPMELKRGIDKAVDAIVTELGNLSNPIADAKEIAQVGTVSANGDEGIGAMISEAMDKVGKEGVITVEENKGLETELKVVDDDLIVDT